MKTCRKCGSRLSPSVDWCVLCYRPVLHPGSADADRPEFPDYVHFVPAPPRSERVVVVPEASLETTIARSGPTKFGLAVKLLITAAIVAIGLGVRALAFAWIDALGYVALAVTGVALGVWAIAAALILWSTWRPERHLTLRVEGEILSVTSARRRADDTRVTAS